MTDTPERTGGTLEALDPDAERRRRRARADRISGVVIALLLLSAFALVGVRIVRIASGPLPPSPGVEAPDFVGSTVDGQRLQLASHRGRVVLVDFWATWCPPCVVAMPTLERMHREFGARGFEVIGVNQEPHDRDTVRRFIKGRGITFPSVFDAHGIAPSWGVYTFPTSFLIGKDGVIRTTYRGPAPESRLRRDIEEALNASEGSG